MPDANSLTPKQREVYELIVDGKTVPQVAKRLKITESGVYGHLRKMRAAGVDPTIEAAGLGSAPDEPPVVPEPVAEMNGRAPTAEEFLEAAINDAEASQAEVAQYIEQRKVEIDHAVKESENLIQRVAKLHAAAEALA